MYKYLKRCTSLSLLCTDITEEAFRVYTDSSIRVYYNEKKDHEYYASWDDLEPFKVGDISDLNDFLLEIGGYGDE